MDGSIGQMEMLVKSLDQTTSGMWDAFVTEHPAATFFHRAGWKRVIERTFGHDCHFLYAESAGRRLNRRAFVTTSISIGWSAV